MFKVGEKVKLASGGAVMTVSNIIDDDFVECQWSNDSGTIFKEKFNIKVLIKYSVSHIQTPYTLW